MCQLNNSLLLFGFYVIVLASGESVLVLGMQEKEGLQTKLKYERNRAEKAEGMAQQNEIRAKGAEGYLNDANSQVDNLERQLNKMFDRMRKLATGIHLAINPHHQVRQTLSQISSLHLP